MNIMEIVLLVIGILVFVASFLIPNGKGDNLAHDREMARDEIGDLVARELERIRSQVDDTVEEAIKDSMDKTERSLEKLSNEKIMAVSEYSETVLGQINKSQQEILFLYDMLNAKHDNLKNTASEVEQRVKEAEIASREVEAVTREAEMAPRRRLRWPARWWLLHSRPCRTGRRQPRRNRKPGRKLSKNLSRNCRVQRVTVIRTNRFWNFTARDTQKWPLPGNWIWAWGK